MLIVGLLKVLPVILAVPLAAMAAIKRSPMLSLRK
jgi:hypothetical protein